MPVISRSLIHQYTAGNGTRHGRVEFEDHTGFKWPLSYSVGIGEDIEVFLDSEQVKEEAALLRRERVKIQRFIDRGAHPALVIPDHLTNAQALKAMLRAFTTFGLDQRAVRFAKWLQANVTDIQLEAVTSPAVRAKIRSAQTRLITSETEVDGHEADRVVIDG